MLYLIKSNNKLKIGYTKNLDSRLKSYKLHNPDAILLMSKDGSVKDEKNLHNLCRDYQVHNEWYNDCEEVVNTFSEYKIETIPDKVERHDDEIEKLQDVIKNLEKYISILEIKNNDLEKSNVKILDEYNKVYKHYDDFSFFILDEINKIRRKLGYKEDVVFQN